MILLLEICIRQFRHGPENCRSSANIRIEFDASDAGLIWLAVSLTMARYEPLNVSTTMSAGQSPMPDHSIQLAGGRCAMKHRWARQRIETLNFRAQSFGILKSMKRDEFSKVKNMYAFFFAYQHV